GGFFGPTIVGWAKDMTGSFAGGLYALAACALISAMVSLFTLRIPSSVRSGELAPAE
ncbi:MAG: MFS transporter, partial [Alphaproteobacteria bacterium]|nr:MFS transporter [Alphaproteobacteria bacterium]